MTAAGPADPRAPDAGPDPGPAAGGRHQGPRPRALQGHGPGPARRSRRRRVARPPGESVALCRCGQSGPSRSATARTARRASPRASARARRPGGMTGRDGRGDSTRAVHAGLPPPAGRAVPARADVRRALPPARRRRPGRLRALREPDVGAPGGGRRRARGRRGRRVRLGHGGRDRRAAHGARPRRRPRRAGRRLPGVRDVATRHLAARGVEVRLVTSDDAAFRAALPGARVVWVETPSNPGLRRRSISRAWRRPRTTRAPRSPRTRRWPRRCGARGWASARTSSWPAGRST